MFKQKCQQNLLSQSPYLFSVLVGLLFLCASGSGFAATQAQYNSIPPFLSTEVPPNVMFMLDNSGSMKNMLADGNTYDTSKTYYGMFEGTSKYRYDTSITLIEGYDRGSDFASPTNSDAPYHVTNVAAAVPGAFVEDNNCTIGAGNNPLDGSCWDGSYLNWLTTRRIDAARKVLIGGKVEYRSGADYITGDGGDLEWKIVANNERSDRDKAQSYSGSQTYTPYPDNTAMTLSSPADSGAEITSGSYDPYAKLKVKVPAVILNSSGTIIGEYGTVSDCGADPKAGNWCTVTLGNNYTNPVVVAGPMTYEGSDPAVVRISAVNAADDSFKVRIEEWEYKDGGHATEDISYLVLEAGAHELDGSRKLYAGTVGISATGVLSSDMVNVNIGSAGFASAPVVLTSVTTDNDHDTVTTRQESLSPTAFTVALQEEKAGGSHSTETVSYVALDVGDYDDGGNTAFQVAVEENVDENWETISFTDAGVTPAFLASMQTSDGPDPAALRYENLDSTSVEVFVEEEASDGSSNEHTNEDIGYVILSSTAIHEYNLALIVEEEPKGLLHDIADKVRLGISLYNYEEDNDIYNGETFNGGTMKPKIPLNPFVKDDDDTGGFRTVETYVDAGIDGIVDAIEHYPLVWGTTPLAENYYDVVRYFQQEASYYESVNSVAAGSYYEVNDDWDPYYFADDAALVPCAQSYVLVFTDGEPYRDFYMPGYNSTNDDYSGSVGDSADYDGDAGSKDDATTTADSKKGNDALDDLALWAHSVVDQDSGSYEVTGDRDLRTDMGNEQNIITYTVGFGSDTLKQILVDTAANGGGLSYAAEDGRQLKTQLTNAFTDILSRSSGTAASVVSNTRSGEGAIYQSVFFPSANDSSSEVNWVGQAHALLVDAYGNMREDSNGNKALDLLSDYIVVYNENGTAALYADGDGNQRLEIDSGTCPIDDDTGACYDINIQQSTDSASRTSFSTYDSKKVLPLSDLKYLWNTSSWLNEISDSSAESQRSPYISTAPVDQPFNNKRYIFTWVDADRDGHVDDPAVNSEILDFTCSSVPSDVTDVSKIYPYLHFYPSFGDRPAEISTLLADDPTTFDTFLKLQSKRQINYIRGSDCADSSDPEDCNTQSLTSIGGTSIVDTAQIYTAMRSRQFDYDKDGTTETWRLGDIVYSTPTLVGRPSENLHLLYRDTTYASYVFKYKDRRQVVYAGANDGMVHAFNAGFYNPIEKQFCKSSDFTDAATCQATDQPALGAELWAYVPYNLLPHLYWLTQPSYDAEKHVYYVDQKPRVFDAKIFTEEVACSDLTAAGCVHPEGWGTVMVIGMNFGGGSIIADIDKTDGASPDIVTTDGDGVDPTMKSAFMIFDITNPEAAPKLLAEIAMPRMGFATSYPTVIAMKDGDSDASYEDYASGENRWYLAFGSGPADINGDPGSANTADGSYDDEILTDVKSLQPGQFYILDLVKLASAGELYTLNSSGVLTSGLTNYGAYDSETFISAPITVDYDLDYNADALYFGTVSGTSKPWGGKLRRIVIDGQNSPADWDDIVMMDVAKPITAAPAIGHADDGRNWVFFGTGRYFNAADKGDTNRQSFYGLKEPLDSGSMDWGTLVNGDLIDVTDFNVYTDRTVDGSTDDDWSSLITDQYAADGWRLDYSDGTGERTLGQAALIGGLLSFTTFTPESDICSAGGESFLWGLYYKTGTAHYSGVLDTVAITVDGETKEKAYNKITLGQGLATSPNIHVGRETGTSVFVQSSTGEITRVEQVNPINTKSGMQSWKLQH